MSPLATQTMFSVPKNVDLIDLSQLYQDIRFSGPVKVKMTTIRDGKTINNDFRLGLYEMGELSTYYAILPSEPFQDSRIITGNNAPYDGVVYSTDVGYTVVKVLRAGEPFGTGVEKVLRKYGIQPCTSLAAMKRIENGGEVFSRVGGRPSWNFEYRMSYFTFEKDDIDNRVVIVADPMLATGGTMKKTTETILGMGKPRRLYCVSCVAAKYGVEAMLEFLKQHPGVEAKLITSEIDYDGVDGTGLDERGYITPGLGDAGDRSHQRPNKRH